MVHYCAWSQKIQLSTYPHPYENNIFVIAYELTFFLNSVENDIFARKVWRENNFNWKKNYMWKLILYIYM